MVRSSRVLFLRRRTTSDFSRLLINLNTPDFVKIIGINDEGKRGHIRMDLSCRQYSNARHTFGRWRPLPREIG